MGEKVLYLDGLRGLAALVVVFHHLACAFLPAAIFGGLDNAHSTLEPWLYYTPLSLLVAGNFSVCIFFVLSGFVLSYKFFITHNTQLIAVGACRRYLRLMPLIFVTTMIAFILLRLHLFRNVAAVATTTGSTEWLALWWNGLPSLGDALRFGLYDAFFNGNHTGLYNNALWTMQIEFVGSFIVFGLMALFGKLRNRWLVYLGAASILWKTYFLAFIIGMALSDARANASKFSLSRHFALWLLGLGLLLGSVPLPSTSRTLLGDLSTTVLPAPLGFTLFHVIGAGMIIASLFFLPKLQSILSSSIFAYLGRVSFSLYTVHLLVIGTLGCMVFLRVEPVIGYPLAVVAAGIASITTSLIAAHILTRIVDEPANATSVRVYRVLFDPHYQPGRLKSWGLKSISVVRRGFLLK